MDQRDSIKTFVRETIACRKVAGLGLTVVQDGQILIVDGFGTRKVDESAPVNQSTLFCIGSITKGFTSTLLASLISRNSSMSWDTPIHHLVPEIQFSDTYRTNHMTLRDILAHRTGIPSYFGALMTGFYRSRKELVRRIRFMRPKKRMNTAYTYNNYMYMLAGYIAERITGKSWDDLIRETFLIPLGMSSTVFADSPTFEDHQTNMAMPHMSFHGKLKQIKPSLVRAVYPAGPAGSICSTPDDMVKWISFQLNETKLGNGERLVKEKVFRDLFSPQILTPTPNWRKVLRKPTFPISEGRTGYGLGWGSGTYRGYEVAMHYGLISGYTSLIWLFREMNLGIFTSVNGPMTAHAMDTTRIIHHFIADVVLGLKPWLNQTTSCSFPEPWFRADYASQRFNLEEEETDMSNDDLYSKKPHTEPIWPNRPLWHFVGQFGHLVFGNLTIVFNDTDNHLHLFHGKVGHGILHKTDEQMVFVIKYIGDLYFLSAADGESVNSYKIRFLEEPMSSGPINKLETTFIDSGAPVIFERGLKWHDIPDSEKQQQQVNICASGANNGKHPFSLVLTAITVASISFIAGGLHETI
ncbi:uncharacterized protein LOC141907747 [Tubulanus polymorphus]|uniref:uncharacterized protein LOC141907747 n=1 Tax=Tubulanus polymorphus TaxID=672921 RepID=UPI003DA3416D